MANVTSSLTSPELVYAATEAILKAQRAIGKVTKFSTDFTADAVQPGSTMMIQFFDDGEAGTFDATNNNYGHADGSTRFIPVPFEYHLKKSFAFTPQDFLEVNGTRFWENSGTAIGRSIEMGIFKTVSELISEANVKISGTDEGTGLSFGTWNKLEVEGAFSKETVATLCRIACDDAEINPSESVLMLDSRRYGEVLATLDANAYGGTEAIRNGMIEGLFGFDCVMENDRLLKDEGTIGAIVPRNALGVAGRIIPIVNTHLYTETGTVTDENSGLTIQFRKAGDANTDRAVLTGEALFGAKLLQPTKIVRIVSAA
jgi:hypothetical protein